MGGLVSVAQVTHDRRRLAVVTWIPRNERYRRQEVHAGCLQHEWRFLERPVDGMSPKSRLVVGLAMWSDYDVEFFSKLLSSSLPDGFPLEVFDMDDVRTEAELQQLIPGGRLPLRTPVLGVIRHGALIEQLEGEIVLAMSADDLVRLLQSRFEGC